MLRRLDPAARRGRVRAALVQHPDRLTGRAAQTWPNCSRINPRRPSPDSTAFDAILLGRHVHIDPYGHIFPRHLRGIILGRAAPGQRSIAEIWAATAERWPEHPVLSAVVKGGSYELLQHVKPLGYVERPGCASKCHLCADIRQWLFETGPLAGARRPARVRHETCQIVESPARTGAP